MNASNVHLTIQPDKSFVQADWGSVVDSVYSFPPCKGAELASGATAGVLEIHLMNDPVDRWYLMPLSSSERRGAIFDKIRTTNTTVVLSSVTAFPL